MTYILAINAGSSSLKATLFLEKNLVVIQQFHYLRVKNHKESFQKLIKELPISAKEISTVAHRVVHGGEKYSECTLITKWVEREIEKLNRLAPLHNPVNLKCIQLAKEVFKCPHFAIFDTAFFQNLPPKSYLYGIPNKYYYDDQIRKYGFHGTNHKYVYKEGCKIINQKRANAIICHLGNGCSVSAIKKGKAIDTSMGFTPLDGLIMGTRSGAIDPGIIIYLQKKYPRLNIENLLLNKSGLLGLSQVSNHMRDIYLAAKDGHEQSKITIDTFCYKVASYVGFYANLLDEIDFIAFTGGIGEKAGYVRQKVMRNLPGLVIDTSQILVIPANEELQMAKEVAKKNKK